MARIEDEIKQSKFRSEGQKLIINLIYTYNQVSGQMITLLATYGLTVQQYNILRILKGQYPTPATNNLVKERMLDRNSDVTRIVDRMIRNGLVTRTSCEKDRRRVDILITQAGMDMLDAIQSQEMKMDDIASNLSIDEQIQLNTLLDKLRGGHAS
jgi:DNA-binding MarR family transcriptional regulator